MLCRCPGAYPDVAHQVGELPVGPGAAIEIERPYVTRAAQPERNGRPVRQGDTLEAGAAAGAVLVINPG